MNENRRSPHQQILKGSTILFNHAAGIDCTVRNASETSALLEIASPIGIPKNFTLVISKDGAKRRCHVASRSAPVPSSTGSADTNAAKSNKKDDGHGHLSPSMVLSDGGA